jgi:putrescine transport system permease protein
MKRWSFAATVLIFGYAFLYIPIFSVIAYSFNDSPFAAVWGGFSLRWYGVLFENNNAAEALMLSIRIALISATFATVLGTCAGLALARIRSFRGRRLFSGMIAAPLVMPEVITGLSLLVLFIALEDLVGWPAGRGADTITIAHITFSMAFVAVVVQARLAGQDNSLEEAAQDLGARPMRVLVDITLPLLAPGMLAGWLLAFTLSFDDLVISSFVSGPESNTLPMYIFSRVKLGVRPDINALATIIMGLVATGVVGAALLMRRQERKRRKDQALAFGEEN